VVREALTLTAASRQRGRPALFSEYDGDQTEIVVATIP